MEDTRTKFEKIVAKILMVPQRINLALMGMLAIINMYTMRICLSVTITQLVLPRPYVNVTAGSVCPKDPADVAHDSERPTGTYDWSQTLQGYILSSFYVGYLLTHIPGGLLSEKFGAKWVLAIGMLSTALFTLLTPVLVTLGGAPVLIVLRILMGFGEGPTFPALSAIMAQWVPKRERGVLGALVLGGGQIGTIVGNYLSGLILDNFTWPWVFYLFGFGAILWTAFFVFLCASDPISDRFISPKEKEYLLQEMGRLERNHNLPPTPWRDILLAATVTSLMLCQIGHDWGFYMMSSNLPKYMNDVMQFSVKSNGLYSSLPFALMWVTSMLSGIITDAVVKKYATSLTLARKINTAIAAFGPAIFTVAASYAGCNRALVVTFFILSMGTMGPYYAGMKLTPLDLSPNYAGTLMALSNGIGSLTGCLVPSVIGWLTPDTTMEQWRVAFWLGFAVLVSTCIPYCIWTSAEVQPWDEGSTRKNKEEAKEVAK